jgi:hypothetical protein
MRRVGEGKCLAPMCFFDIVFSSVGIPSRFHSGDLLPERWRLKENTIHLPSPLRSVK